jgi:group I intron endonuclease
MNTGYVYGLVDPNSFEVRYIGKTIRDLEVRLYEHTTRINNTHKSNWIKSLGNSTPSIINLFEHSCCDVNELNSILYEKEQLLINEYPNLTNHTDGGQGLVGHKFTEEHKKKISDALSGENNPMYGRYGENNPYYGKKHSDEIRKKISNSLIGTKHTKEHRENISKANKGKKRSKEFIENLRVKNLGENNPMYGKPAKNRKFSDEEITNILITYDEVKSYRKVADIFGVGKSTISNIVKKRGY